MNVFVTMLIQTALKLLGELIVAFIENLRKARMDDPDLAGVVLKIVQGINNDHPEWDNEQKWRYAKDAVIQYGKGLGKDFKDSLINTLIELAVQKVKLNG